MKPTISHELAWAHPLVQDWFIAKFTAATEPQCQGWPAILAGQATLISAPTGSGKTLAAFLACIDALVRQAVQGELPQQTVVLYVSPLKALSNDVQKNLMQPLSEIKQLAKQRGMDMADISVAVRTGDTLMRERTAMLKKPPHILVTTPESLYILLTAEKSRIMLQTVQTVIIDEIHALANNKRGTHLLLSLERLEALTSHAPLRIALSATQKPLETMARFLVGQQRPLPIIVNIGHAKHIELTIEIPDSELAAVAANETWDEIYRKLATLTQQNRATLVFVNTRRLAERVAHHLAELVGEEFVATHHGSLSRKLRLAAETKLKRGELKVLVATASLELGIDIGNIDLVCQIGSPRAIAAMLQRVGRAGHWFGAISKGRIFATTRNELLECAALVYAIRSGELDQLIIPVEPLDVLAQQIVATCATGDWREDDLYQLVKKSYPYNNLSRESFTALLVMLADGIAGSRGRYGTYLFRDQVNGVVKARRGSRLTAITSGGAIPETGLFNVIAEPNNILVGTLDEDFAVESNRGDVMLLGTTSWKIIRVENARGRVLVEDAHGAPPSVPFWRGEAPARTDELSYYVSKLREKLDALLTSTDKASEWLMAHCGVEQAAAAQLLEYVSQGRALLGAVPTQKTIIAERFFDESGGMQLVIHAPFGARINKAWGLALRKRFCRSFNFELQAQATDDGLNIALAEQHSFPLADVFHFLHPNSVKEVIIQAVLQSPLFKTRWRWVATRALALVRFRGGKKVPPNIQRMLADDLLAAVFPDAAACQDNMAGEDIILPDQPLINETMKDCLTEALDVEGLLKIISAIVAGDIQCLAVDTPLPSVFSHEILNANPYAYLDDAPIEERRARAVEMRRMLPEAVLKNYGRLDPMAILEVQQQAWPDIRNADELHDFLQTVIALPEAQPRVINHLSEYLPLLNELTQQGRVTKATYASHIFWFAAEKSMSFTTIYPTAHFNQILKIVDNTMVTTETAIENMLRGWLLHLGPVSAEELAEFLAININDINHALLKLETTGLILRGHFREQFAEQLEWCERRLLARIHRITVGILRKEIEPISPADFMRWLLQWQHVAANSQLVGEQGLLEVIKQLQGFEIAANAWEKQILAKRVKDYTADLLDRLCLMGIVGWGRLSNSATIVGTQELTNKKRILPTSIVPITFFVREEAGWMPLRNSQNNIERLSSIALDIYHFLQQRGASFFTDIVVGVKHLKSQVELGLWELVAAGLITADGFDNLRALIDPKRRLQKHRRKILPRYNHGRWSLLPTSSFATDTTEHIEACCWMLLKRYGVIFRDLLLREKNIPRWRELLLTLRLLEAKGEIRGGRFIDGFLGEQFALPYAVESLRAIKKQVPDDLIVTLSANDPLNLIGIILPGARIGAVSNKTVQLKI